MTKLTIFVVPAVSEDEDSDITLQEISLDSALELDRNGEIPKETTGDQHAKGNFICYNVSCNQRRRAFRFILERIRSA